MTVHDLLAGLDPRANWPGFLSLLVGAVAAVVLRLAAPAPESLWLRRLTGVAAGLLLALAAVQGVLAVLYLALPVYLDYVEPATAAVGWMVWHGQPLYPPIGSDRLYAQVYGPFLFQVSGLFLELFGPSIAASKLPGLVGLVLGLALCFGLFRRSGARPLEALTIAAALCVVQAGFANQGYSFGVRADPWLFVVAAGAALVATSGPSAANAALLGALGGIATNVKADAGLYIAPVFLFFLSSAASWPQRMRFAAAGVAAGAAVLALPFLGPNISFTDYLALLRLSSHRPFFRWLAEQNVVMMALELTPALWLAMLCRRALPRGMLVFLAATIVCMLVVLVPASAEGAGPYHFLPFLPSLAWAALVLYRAALKSEAKALAAPVPLCVLAALVLGYGPVDAASIDFTLRAYQNAPAARRAAAEIAGILDRLPGQTVSIGPATYAGYDVGDLRVIAVFRGDPLLIDPVTLTQYLDYEETWQAVRTILGECKADVWLWPHGWPSAAWMPYPAEKTVRFFQAMSVEFQKHYALFAPGPVFDQWRCQGKAGATGTR